nr:MAG TPA: hypothetical protein [Caudoviricetes sp.]
MTSQGSKYKEGEYIDVMVTLELSAKFAMLERRPVNGSIKSCWQAIRPRVTNDLNRKIFDCVSRQAMPHGALCMLRRQLDECA